MTLQFRTLGWEQAWEQWQDSLHWNFWGQADAAPSWGGAWERGWRFLPLGAGGCLGSGSGAGARGHSSKRGESRKEVRRPQRRDPGGMAEKPRLRAYQRAAGWSGWRGPWETQAGSQSSAGWLLPSPISRRRAGGKAAAEILTQSRQHPWRSLPA